MQPPPLISIVHFFIFVTDPPNTFQFFPLIFDIF